jgi:hypothetical protein
VSAREPLTEQEQEALIAAFEGFNPVTHPEIRLRRSLERYGRHDASCPAREGLAAATPQRCSCGFHAALQANPVEPDDLLSRAAQGVREREATQTSESVIAEVAKALDRWLAGYSGQSFGDELGKIIAQEVVEIARCPEHGLHGARTRCFVCDGPVEQVPLLPINAFSSPPSARPSGEVDGRDGFTLSWRDGAYYVSVPNLLAEGERLEVVPCSRLEQYTETCKRERERRLDEYRSLDRSLTKALERTEEVTRERDREHGLLLKERDDSEPGSLAYQVKDLARRVEQQALTLEVATAESDRAKIAEGRLVEARATLEFYAQARGLSADGGQRARGALVRTQSGGESS